MSHFSRTINISAGSLGDTDATLLLIFDEQPIPGIYSDYFPVVWKTHTFPATGHNWVSLTYKNQLVFADTRVESNLAISETWGNVNPGQQTDLIKDPTTEKITFTEPRSGVARYIKATNKTQDPQNIGIGFINGGSSPPPTLLLFKDVHSTENVTAQFFPILKAYITEHYREHEVIRQPIKTVPSIWKQDLAALDEISNWQLQYDSASGKYSITEA